MDPKRSFPRRSFIVIMLFMSLLLLITDLSYDFGIKILLETFLVPPGSGGDGPVNAQKVVQAFHELKLSFTGISAALFFSLGFFLWGALMLSKKDRPEETGKTPKEKGAASPEKPVENKQDRLESDRRMYLHLLSVFQREGRLVDFFSEDLSLYEDAQIGAAVRSIHENCKKSMEKYLKPSAVMEENEGDEVTIDASFNAEDVKLIGNVAGTPPFKGILRHKGWKAGKTELPKLSAGKDSRLIAPAEVEIL